MLVVGDRVMGTTKSRITYSVDGSLELPEDHTLPGYTVDALLKQGKIQEARQELERLLQEGIDSGPGIEATPQFWEDIRAEVRRRVKERG
jgi:hypothetical protein